VGRVLMSHFETELQTDKLRPYLSAYIRSTKAQRSWCLLTKIGRHGPKEYRPYRSSPRLNGS
jgi:hypothetical protein